MIARVVLGVAGAALVGLFLAALVHSVPPAPIHVAVIAEPVADPRTPPYVVRLSAVDARGKRSVTAKGNARLGVNEAAIESDVARVAVDPAAAELALVLEVEGSRALSLSCAVQVGARPAPPSLWVPAAPERVTVTGVRKRSVAVTVEGASVHADVQVPDRDTLSVELLIDGALRDVRVLDVEGRARVTFALPPDVASGATVVVHAAEPWPLARGAYGAAIVGASRELTVLDGLAPAQLRPAPLACAEVAPRFPHLWRSAFEVASAVFVIALVAALWWRSRAEARRGALLAVVAGVVMSACLLGLDLVLRLGAAGGP